MTESLEERRKLNCWEVMQCGREPGGGRVGEMGVCPAAVEARLDGVLGGVNAGRCCWMVAGTACNGEPQGTFARRYASCQDCHFFKTVQTEEAAFLSNAGSLLLYLSAAETEQRDRLRLVLGSVIDPAVAGYALGDPGALRKQEEKHVTAFFSDITGFSTVSGALDATTLGSFLGEYLAAMTEILKAEGGTLDKYIGDGIVGIFGAPIAMENDALSAARAALRMQERLARLRSEWRARGTWCPQAWSLQMRIGLSSGLAKVGFMGTSDFASYTMTGATVNLAKWLERTCKTYGVSILV
ncbi:MAG: adenylate/guanylate cyclase domain-containing protein, partial [Gemmatimonas sp.]